ncbi:MAG: NAD(P)(+) transhydrogenase (Re/Si-specific) subunit beta [Rhodothermales bacterium]|nr:NAD(P)(+) transhydrogenase (Re/Si-specific) subunit beta [Rhodothermales bacterium]
MKTQIIDLIYLLAAVLFILGLKRLTSPATARAGNQMAAVGMFIAAVATLFIQQILTPVEMIVGLVVGGGIGAILARKVAMTGMPELVAAFNGFGGLASALVAGAEIARYLGDAPLGTVDAIAVGTSITIALSVLIGTVTFSGSFIAFGKLAGKITGNPIVFPGMRVLTVLLALGIVGSTVFMAISTPDFPAISDPVVWSVLALAGMALIIGVLLVIPIGGADMPVVVSLLNSYSGLAAAATGFVLNNVALIVSGALVGAAGLILTMIMCEAMNRSLLNVLIGGFGGDQPAPGAGGAVVPTGLTVHSTTPEDSAILLSYAQKVIFVPGYGMAVAQAQHTVRELAELLQENGVEVKYAIHPVAGRMPGHMNVLLAEANVPYDLLFEMDDINGEFDSTDVAVVIGANDVVNPAARHDTASPIYGMPILNVDHAQTVIVMKRSLNPGYAGIDNELFYGDNTRMLFGDAKDSMSKLVTEVKAL